MKKAINAKAYIECSARYQKNVKEAFETAVRVVLYSQLPVQETLEQPKGDKGCEIG
jgi:Ras-related C3 botulinum toxin substrate 1